MTSSAAVPGKLGDRSTLFVRYVAVSALNIVGHQSLLFVSNSIWGWTGGLANVFAATVMSVPAYLLSRNWVWKMDGDHDLRQQLLPFWIITVAGLLVSTGFAAAAQAMFGKGLPVNLASLVGYFLVWVAKFFLLNRVFQD